MFRKLLLAVAAAAALLGRVDGLGRVYGEWIPKFVDL
jgi:hypothetical protein